VGAHVDVTRLKRAEAALREADRRKNDLIAMLGHELRNPLTVISTAVQMLRKKGPADPALNELRATIEHQVSQISRLLEDLLDVSRIEHGQIRLNRERCDLSSVVRQVTEDHRMLFVENGVDLVVRVPAQPLWVMGDRARLTQILGNLLHNANKFTDSDGKVTVDLSESGHDQSAVLTIRDTGIGMEPEMLVRAFEPFVQAVDSVQRSRGGLGLGLALVRGFVELHGGNLSASSGGVGKGTEFTIRLPLARDLSKSRDNGETDEGSISAASAASKPANE
jgi:signal transduction histidine kinase